MTLSMLFDILVCVGLCAGFLYTLWFNKKLTSVQNSRQQFQNLLDTFSTALERGQQSLSQLQETNTRVVRELDQKMGSASLLVEDLTFFIDRGEGMMTQLEDQMRAARTAIQDFENIMCVSEEGQSSVREEARAGEEKEKDPLSLDRLKEEKLFKTEVRLDHPWGTLHRKRHPLNQGGGR